MSDSIVWDITAEDVLKGTLVDPGFHPTEVYDFAIEDSKTGDSKNVHLKMRIFAGPFKGVENDFIYFSEKLKVMMTPLLIACGFPQNPDGSFNVRLSKEAILGKKFLAEWTRGNYNNKPVNQITNYAKLME